MAKSKNKPKKPKADRGPRVGGKPVDAPEVVQQAPETTETPANTEATAGDKVDESPGAIPEVVQSPTEAPSAESDPSVIDASFQIIDEPAKESKPLRLALDVEAAKIEAEAFWNAEFVRKIEESEKRVRVLAGEEALARADASRKKKALDTAEEEHFELIRKLQEEKNQPVLFPGFNPGGERGRAMEREGLTESPDKDMSPADWEAQRGSATDGPAVAVQSEENDLSWREYPLQEYAVRGGLAQKIVNALLDYGIRTVGAFADYSTPKPGSTWTADLTDIPGIGKAAVQKIWAADTNFWTWWNGKEQIEARNAKRSGVGSGANPGGGDGSTGEPSSVGDGIGAGGDDSPGGETIPAGSDSVDSASLGESRDEFAADFNGGTPGDATAEDPKPADKPDVADGKKTKRERKKQVQ